MKPAKIFLSSLSIAALAGFSACSSAPTANTAATNNANAATVTNSAPKPSNTPAATNVNAANSASNAKSPAAKTEPKGETQTVEGRYQTGKTESLILYVGMETGDYAAYCFDNDSEAARAIAAACKNGEQCEVNAVVEMGDCKVPGLEGGLSFSGRIAKVNSAKALGPARKAK